jgi:hypothetical protein
VEKREPGNQEVSGDFSVWQQGGKARSRTTEAEAEAATSAVLDCLLGRAGLGA